MSDFRYTLVPLPDFNLFWATFHGDLTIRGLGDAHDAFTSHPAYREGIDELLDFSRSSVEKLDKVRIDTIREYMTDQLSRHNRKSGIVINSQLEFGLVRMMGANLDKDAPMERGVFYSIEDALAWMRPEQEADIVAAYKRASERQAG